jgi:REP element-mobilizing transposase RayT
MKQGSQALRKGRHSSGGFIYHIRFSTHNKKQLIHFETGSAIAKKFTTYFNHREDELLCWVLMPDHVHLLVKLGSESTLEQTVRTLKSSTSRLFPNQKPFWQAGYFDRALRKEEDLKDAARYIVANPIRAGLVKSVREYSLWDAVWL